MANERPKTRADLSIEINDLENLVSELRTDNQLLGENNRQLVDELKAVYAEIARMSRETSAVRSENARLQGEAGSLRSQLKSLESSLRALTWENKGYKREVAAYRRGSGRWKTDVYMFLSGFSYFGIGDYFTQLLENSLKAEQKMGINTKRH